MATHDYFMAHMATHGYFRCKATRIRKTRIFNCNVMVPYNRNCLCRIQSVVFTSRYIFNYREERFRRGVPKLVTLLYRPF